ncbi:MAG: alpha-galactosidase [Fimbriimonas sp.]
MLAAATMALFTTQISSLPLWNARAEERDWLLGGTKQTAGVFRTTNPNEFVLANGLIARTFRLSPAAATVAITDLRTNAELLRGIKPEAELTLDGKPLSIGGLVGQPDLAYLTPAWLNQMKPGDSPFTFETFEVAKTSERLTWKRVRTAPKLDWPPKGAALTLWFKGQGLRVGVHYEIFDGLPVLSKWLTVQSEAKTPVRIDSFTSELLRFVEPDSVVDDNPAWSLPNVTVATDYSFGGMAMNNSNRTVYWQADKEYTTQVNYRLATPCVLEVKPPLGPSVDLQPGQTFTTFRTFELFHDSTERERKGLGIRRMFRLMAPWSSENPLMLHLTSVDPKVVHTAIDQASECGFEMVIISFWSGLDMEDVSAANVAKFREFREYANSKGIELGGYSLLASRRIDDANDVINPKTMKTGGAIFDNSPCLCSKWGQEYFAKIRKFISETGFQVFEHDGSYPGDPCASTKHPGHRGLEDSQWKQYQEIASLYRWARERGMYLNVPDNYFLAGSNKTGMGYRESNWSLPREQQHIHARQNLFDGTWEKTPSMGWMMVPLVEYQGGGPAATIEPLKEHLQDYELHLANNLGYGAQACYRGPRLYDSPETKAAVIKWVTWFKKHRELLESDVIHVRRADGQNLDAVLHVLPGQAMAVIYNPTDAELEQEITLPLYYAGLHDTARIAIGGGRSKAVKLTPDQKLKIKPKVAGKSCTWITIQEN